MSYDGYIPAARGQEDAATSWEERFMDEDRYEELMEKRGRVGLSETEAAELGRMMAEKMGKPYQGYSDIHPHHTSKNGGAPVVREPASDRNS
jgi:hypothetical protein